MLTDTHTHLYFDSFNEDFEGRLIKRFFAYYLEEEFLQVLARNRFSLLQSVTRQISPKTTWLTFFVQTLKNKD